MQPQPGSIGQFLAEALAALAAADIDACGRDPARAVYEAQQILMRAAGLDRLALLDKSARLDPALLAKARDVLARRLRHEPLSRIVGEREFWGLPFRLNAATLDPRPDSETVIEAAHALYPDHAQPLRILDIGTGSGCLLLALLHDYKNARGIGIDCAPEALEQARANAEALGLAARAAFRAADIFDSGWPALASARNIGEGGRAEGMGTAGAFDLVISNPPYIPHADTYNLARNVKDYDPILALDGGPDGLAAYRAIIPALHSLVRANGHVLFEIGFDQAASVQALLAYAGVQQFCVHKDLGGQDRVVSATIIARQSASR